MQLSLLSLRQTKSISRRFRSNAVPYIFDELNAPFTGASIKSFSEDNPIN